jgi:hypothetical protein
MIQEYLRQKKWEKLQAGIYRIMFKNEEKIYLVMVEKSVWKYSNTHHWYWRIVDLSNKKNDYLETGFEYGFADAKKEVISFLCDYFEDIK